MRAIVTEYLEKPDKKLLLAMTSEEQRYIGRVAKPSGKRARNKKGQLEGDDPATPEVNEAFEDGKTPKKQDADT